MRTLLLLVSVLGALGAGCLRKTEFKCSESTQCGAGGACESTGFCSFADPDCDSGRRYADYAGTTHSNQCVGGGTTDPDGGVDGPMDDAPDTTGCPASYSTTIGTHQYRVIATVDDSPGHASACSADGQNAYLAIPDDQAELTALLDAAGADIWVGMVDGAADNEMIVTVKGAAVPSSSPLWDGGAEPDDNPESGGGNSAECVMASDNSDRLNTDRCTTSYVAVCECEP